jgi:hypothetical protein
MRVTPLAIIVATRKRSKISWRATWVVLEELEGSWGSSPYS